MRFKKETRELFLYNVISKPFWMDESGVDSAGGLLTALEELGDGDILLRINSPGGSVDEATAMQNILARHNGKVTATIDAIAASAATIVMLGASKIIAASNSRVMIHKANMIAFGNAKALRKEADILDTYDQSILAAYAEKTGKPVDELQKMMEDETWMTAAEALEHGFIDEIGVKSDVKPAKMVANWYKNAPKDLTTQPESRSVPAARILAKLKAQTMGVKRG